MINTLGPYLLILILKDSGIAIQKLDSFESCQTALIQLQPARELYGYCIAAEVK